MYVMQFVILHFEKNGAYKNECTPHALYYAFSLKLTSSHIQTNAEFLLLCNGNSWYSAFVEHYMIESSFLHYYRGLVIPDGQYDFISHEQLI